MSNEMKRDPIEAAFEELGMKREYEDGDLVRWDNELFYVDGAIFEAGRSPDEHTEDILYSISRVYGDGSFGDFAEVYQDDEGLRLVCRAAYADEFIANSGMDADGGGTATMEPGASVFIISGRSKPTPPAKGERQRREEAEGRRKREYREWLDEKLDELSAAKKEADMKKVAEILTEFRTRQAIFEAGGDVGGVEPEEADHERG